MFVKRMPLPSPYASGMRSPLDADLVIAGAGPAGLSLAAALADTPLRVLVVERAPLSALAEPQFDGREIALTHASMRRLRSLKAWDRIAGSDIAPLKLARVQNGGSTFALQFNSRHNGEALGALVSNSAIRRALFETLKTQENCTILADHAVVSLKAEKNQIEASTSGDLRLAAKLAVAADTRFSPLRQAQGIPAHMVDFGRTMLVCRMSHTTPHDGVATEWFGRAQTVAMLPLAEGVSSYVLTLPAHEIETLLAISPEAFATDAMKRAQGRWGRMELISTRHAYPLVAVYADRFCSARFALVGDAAVGMHPVTAHGYNFGLAGACRLADELRRAAAHGGDIGDAKGLRRYDAGHRRATWPLFAATNALAKLYGDDRPLARLARGSTLRLMQAFSPVRHAIETRLSA